MLKTTKQKGKENIRKSRKRGAREQGITLVALVITIIAEMLRENEYDMYFDISKGRWQVIIFKSDEANWVFALKKYSIQNFYFIKEGH